jgi:hypothetical protein
MRRWAQLDELWAERDGLLVPVLRLVVQCDLDTH